MRVQEAWQANIQIRKGLFLGMMDKRTLLGGLTGSILILVFSLAPLLLLNQVLDFTGSNLVIGSMLILLAPIAGGFTAGKISKTNPRLAGLIAGLGASLVVWIAWLFIAGISLQNMISGLVILFIWVLLARLASGFASTK